MDGFVVQRRALFAPAADNPAVFCAPQWRCVINEKASTYFPTLVPFTAVEKVLKIQVV
jgi:hypothetical protein